MADNLSNPKIKPAEYARLVFETMQKNGVVEPFFKAWNNAIDRDEREGVK